MSICKQWLFNKGEADLGPSSSIETTKTSMTKKIGGFHAKSHVDMNTCTWLFFDVHEW